MNKPVDNRREMRITTRFLWIPSRIAGNWKWLAAGPCAALAYAVEMSHRWKRVLPGGDPGNVGGAGRLVPRMGTWPRRAARGVGKAGRLASPVRRGQAGPLHLIHGGALLILSGWNALAGPVRRSRACRPAPRRLASAAPRSCAISSRSRPGASRPGVPTAPRKHRRADRLLPANAAQGTAYRLAVHNVWMTCAKLH